MTRATLALAALLAGCSSSTPTTPTAPTTPPPPVVTTPPVTTPAAPTITSYAGTWRGNYVIERCSGAGSIEDVLCSAGSGSRPGGIYPVGTVLPLAIQLSQSGSSVTGVISFGEVTGPVTGVVSSSNRLTLQGTSTSGALSLAITTWDASLSADQLIGAIAYNASVTGYPGFATVSSRLSGVRR